MLSTLARKSLAKKINEKCRKVLYCPFCGGVNGEVASWEGGGRWKRVGGKGVGEEEEDS